MYQFFYNDSVPLPEGSRFFVLSFQLKISFDDHATTTFEYDREEAALEAYLEEHPEEREEALRQEEEEVSSVVSDINDDPTKDSPRHSESETLKSNTVIGQPTGKNIFKTLRFKPTCWNILVIMSS